MTNPGIILTKITAIDAEKMILRKTVLRTMQISLQRIVENHYK
jgi:hypothetical protein